MQEVISLNEENAISLAVQLDTPEKRFNSLSGSFAMSIYIIARMESQRDWETLTRPDGSPYRDLVDIVQEAMNVSRGWAQKMVQTSERLYSPLEAIVVKSTPILISSTQAGNLSGNDMDNIVHIVEDRIDDNQAPEEQARIITDATNEYLENKKADKSSGPNTGGAYQPEDFEDIPQEEIDRFIPSFDNGDTRSFDGDFGEDEFMGDAESDFAPPPPKRDFVSRIKDYLKSGKQYVNEEDIDTLPPQLQEIVRAINTLAEFDAQTLAGLVNEDTRGVIGKIDNAISNVTTFKSVVETSPWVLMRV